MNQKQSIIVDKTRKMMRNVHLVAFLVAAVLVSFLSCRGDDEARGGRTVEEYQRLKAVGDSVNMQSPRARELVDSALANTSDSLNYYDYYVELVRYYLIQHSDSALPCCNRILHFASRQKPTSRVNGLIGEAYHLRASYYYNYRQKYDEAIADNKLAYKYFLQSEMKNNASGICANIGDVCMEQSHLPEAASWYRRALVLTDSLQLPEEDAYTFYMGLGRIYCILQDYKLSEEYYEKARQGYDDMPLNMKVYFLNNYGNLKYYSQKYKRAMEVFTSLDSLLAMNGLKGGWDDYLCQLNLSDVLLNLGRTDESMAYLAPADSFFRANNVGDAVYYANTIRIGNALKRGELAAIKRILTEEPAGLTIDEDMKDIRSRYLHEYYMQMGDVKRAYQVEWAYNHRKDSLDQSREHMRSADIMMRLSLDTLELHNQLRLNEKEAQISHDRLLYTFIILGVLIVALALLAWTLYLRKRNSDNQLEIVNLRISNTRNVIAPHFVFNVLKHASLQSGPEADNSINGIIRLMRSQINVARRLFVTLREELDFTENYLALAGASLGPDFEYTIDKPGEEALDSRPVPSTFVQILAENAVKHALSGMDGPKRLHIAVELKERDTVISVEDNGPGFDIRRSSSNSTGTGLRVIQRTLALHNESHRRKMFFQVKNLPGEEGKMAGCRVTLVVPVDVDQGIAKA
jgi:tetratricopeptide (TPR) repeat protein